MNLWIAAADGNVALVEEFLSKPEFNPNSKDANGYTPLHAAAEYGHLELLEKLVKQGGDINVKDNDGDTPLHACEQVKTARKLIELGADVAIKNDEGLTPLQKAEEEADFPELISYYREINGVENNEGDELPDNVKLSVQGPDQDLQELPSQVTEEQRAQLGHIIEHGTDADFEKYLKEVLGADKPSSEDRTKKSKTE